MLRNYINTAINTLRKNKGFSAINILGLALGITVTLLILMYVVNELSYEGFQKNRKNIYRIALNWGTDGNIMKFAGSMPALASAIDSAIPEVRSAIRIRKDYDAVIINSDDQEIREDNTFFADPGIFQIFTFPLTEGNPSTALVEPYSIVISEKTAKKYFGSADPLGKELTYNDSPLRITGVMKNVPENTHIYCDLLISYSTLKAMGEDVTQPWNTWGNDLTYILLKNHVQPKSLIPKLSNMLKVNTGDWLSSRMTFELQPLNQIHWDNTTRGDIGPKGNKTYVYIFLSAAIFILLIACFNFLNLSISKYLGRVTEVAIRKTAGAKRKQLIYQFLTETMVIVIMSGIIGIFLFEQFYNSLYSYLGNTNVLISNHFIILSALVFLIVIIVGLTAGVYPALYISKFIPVEVFRKESMGKRGKLTLRKLLVVVQFAIAIILLVGTGIIYRQLDFVKNSNLGFSKDDVLLLNFPGQDEKVKEKYNALRDELMKNTNIRYASGAYTIPGINSQMNISARLEGSPEDNAVIMQALPADYGFVKSMGLKLIKGRDFSKEFSTDRRESAILNQAAVKALGLKQPVGARIKIPGEAFKKGVSVIGVVSDFHVKSFHEKINPMIIYINPDMYITIALKINPENSDATIAYIKEVWNSILPGTALSYRHLEDAYDNLYGTEEKSGRLLAIFSLLAIFISCLGLFGFASFIVNKRIKEVGIRKVLGAKPSRVLLLLSRQFTAWILASSILACPLAYLLAKKWLGSFVFHINIEWWIFALAIAAELLIAFLTVSWQSFRVATRNPVEALRYE